MKRFLATLLLIALFLPALCVGVSAAAPRVTFRVGQTEISQSTVPTNNRIRLPEAPTAHLGSRTFIGWATQEGLYPAGAVYIHTPDTDIVFEAISVDLQTMRGAAVSLTGAPTLRFDGAIDRAGYDRLLELVGASNVTCGVLVALYKEVYGGTRVFTHDADPTIAPSLRDRVATAFSFSTEPHRFFSGRTDAVGDSAILEKYAGRAYLTVTMSNGTAYTYYAAFDPDQHARTVHGVSAFAFEDRDLSTPDGRYSAANMQALRARLDRVVNVDQTTGAVCNEYSHNNIDFLTYRYYTSPYRVSEIREDFPANGKETYVIVGRDGGDFRNITAYFMGGSYRQSKGNECNSDGYYITVNSYTI